MCVLCACAHVAIESLLSDSPRNSNCTACFTDNATHAALMEVRGSIDAGQRARCARMCIYVCMHAHSCAHICPHTHARTHRYDRLQVCYSQLTDAIMRELPKDGRGVYLAARSVAN